QPPVVGAPDVHLARDPPRVRSVDDDPTRLAAAVRTRLAEAGGDRDDDTADVAGDDLELVALADGALMDVAADDQLGAGVDEPRQNVGPARDGLLARSPRRADHLMVERDDPQRAVGRALEALGGTRELRVTDAAGLVAPRAHR